MRICVFCSSSNAIDTAYLDESRALGREMATRGHSLTYGGGDVGSMGVLARAVQENGGMVLGVIPHALNDIDGVGYGDSDRFILTNTMRERKAIMEENSDAFIALPGGLGTFEEVLEIITLKQLRYHSKAIVLVNSGGYFDPLLALLNHAVSERFMKPKTLDLFEVTESFGGALDYIESYVHIDAPLKWYAEIPAMPDQTLALE